MSHTIRHHPTGCLIVEGSAIPMSELIKLVGDHKVADAALSHQLGKVAIVGTKPQIAALRQQLEFVT